MQQNPRHLINGRWEIGTTTGVSINPSDTRSGGRTCPGRQQPDRAGRACRQRRAGLLEPQRPAAPGRRAGPDRERAAGHARTSWQAAGPRRGKTLPEAVAEVARSGQNLQVLRRRGAAHPGRTAGIGAPGRAGGRHPRAGGCGGHHRSLELPFAIPAWKIAPARAYGNTVVFKPAENVPTCGWALAEIISRSGLPAGAFNLVMGSGPARSARPWWTTRWSTP